MIRNRTGMLSWMANSLYAFAGVGNALSYPLAWTIFLGLLQSYQTAGITILRRVDQHM
jgi:hypothetical protein